MIISFFHYRTMDRTRSNVRFLRRKTFLANAQGSHFTSHRSEFGGCRGFFGYEYIRKGKWKYFYSHQKSKILSTVISFSPFARLYSSFEKSNVGYYYILKKQFHKTRVFIRIIWLFRLR